SIATARTGSRPGTHRARYWYSPHQAREAGGWSSPYTFPGAFRESGLGTTPLILSRRRPEGFAWKAGLLHFHDFTGHQRLFPAVIATEPQRPTWVEARRCGQHIARGGDHPHALAARETGSRRPALRDGRASFLQQQAVVPLQFAQQRDQHLHA